MKKGGARLIRGTFMGLKVGDKFGFIKVEGKCDKITKTQNTIK